MAASQPANFNLQEFTDAGLLLVGGRLYTYAFGTTTQKIAYTDPAGVVPQTYTADGFGGFYIALNARGELSTPLYLSTGSYDLTLKRSDGSTVWTRRAEGVENTVSASLTAFTSSLSASSGSSLVGFMQSGTGAVARTAQDKMRDTVSVFDFMTTAQIADCRSNTASLDVIGAFTTALAASNTVYVPQGTYRISGAVTINGSKKLIGADRTSSILLQVTASQPNILVLGGADVTVRGLTLDRTPTATAGGHGIDCQKTVGESTFTDLRVKKGFYGMLLGPTDYSTVSNCFVENSASHGVVVSNQADAGNGQWYMDRVISQTNGGNGYFFNAVASNGEMSMGSLSNCAAFANGARAFVATGTATSVIHSVRLINCFFGADAEGEIYLDTYGELHKITSTFLELSGDSASGPNFSIPRTNRGIGIELTANNKYTSISDCEITQMAYGGIYNGAQNTTIDNTRIVNCGRAQVAGKRYGVLHDNVTGFVKINCCTMGNFVGVLDQLYGIQLNYDNMIVMGCDLSGNITAPIDPATPLVNSTVLGCVPTTIASVHPGQLKGFTAGGLVVGNATGGSLGAGSINASSNILRNNVAYNNP